MTARCCVVVCYWIGRSPAPLYTLLRQMQAIPAGEAFDVLIVCNGGDVAPFKPRGDFSSLNLRVMNRINEGWNLGAWEAGWRASPSYDYYLFLQAECVIKAPDWLARFVSRISIDAGIGLLGERLMWQGMTWEYVRAATALDLGASVPAEVLESVEVYQRLLREHGIDPGPLGTHLVSIILFSSRAVLEQIDGIPMFGQTYLEAVASEIGLSRRVMSIGMRIAQLADDPFFRIGHTQWMRLGRIARLCERARERLYRFRRP